MNIKHDINDIIRIFDNTFYSSFNTKLVRGDDEPVYLPADENNEYHRIIFAHGFFQSALHEISHWLIAGEQRRLQEDFGYWYRPDGRTEQEQLEFEQVEIKPQAIEWALSVACQKPFDVSVDNLNGSGETCRYAFKAKVLEQVKLLLTSGFSNRTQQLINALSAFYNTPLPLTLEHFKSDIPQEVLAYDDV